MKPHEESSVAIWETVRRIPRGKVLTYGDVARLAGLPRQARLAGYALHNMPLGADIPWQRVINARGEISLTGSAAAEQKKLLEEEGVHFRGRRVDLNRYRWNGRRSKREKRRPRRARV
jgi:methylated-DNA-protein-cysteine methyltransferase-like protein